MAQCFSRGRRVTAAEPQRTLAAVSGGGRGGKHGRREQRQDGTWTHRSRQPD